MKKSAYIFLVFLLLLLTGAAYQQSSCTHLVVTKDPSLDSALEINAENRLTNWLIKFNTVKNVAGSPQLMPSAGFNARGAYYTNTWMIVSGVPCLDWLKGIPCTAETWKPVQPASTAHIAGFWGDVPDVVVSRAANIDP